MSVAPVPLLRLVGVLTCCAPLLACASQIDQAAPSFATLQMLRNQNVPPMALGSFTAQSPALRRSVTIRLSVMHAPKGHDFADFLGTTFETELRAAGKLDATSLLQLDGVLTESRAGEDFAKGGASLGATITLRRGSATIFSKPYRVEAHWKSEFIGAIAIPEAFRQYNSLYALLAREVLCDPEFIAASKR